MKKELLEERKYTGEENGKCNPCWLRLGAPVIARKDELENGNKDCNEHRWELREDSGVCRMRPSLWFWDCQKYQCSRCGKKALVQTDLGDMGFVCGKDNPY